ncbi:site-specific integrase [Haliangium sp. UPWRP_2]|uniref:tyrosine-type recombinase/integrase n=1 Tax=Haliangium sp. UPWRP_2 TaxID=1931276 RepID=UPI000B53C3D4|nr:site-specific integrase [Haliangium sp. UPWRP_2]PSM32377.1 site-specific integrase [Haliangium sp. UPWRP_2]HNN97208.1 site-specific integrase [Pseudomonadota bacterium]
MDPKRDPKTRSTDGASPTPTSDAATRGPTQAQYCVAHALSDLLTRGCADNAAATRNCYTQRAGHLLRILGDLPLASLQLDNVQAFIDQRIAEGAARETIRKEICVLRRALDLAHKRRILASLPEALLPRFRTRYVPKKVWLSPEQFERLLSSLVPARQTWLLTAVYTGARLSELCALTWADVDFAAGLVHVRGTKTERSDRLLPMHPRLAQRPKDERKVRGPVLAPWGSVRRDLAVACRKLGVPVVTPNDLRRTFASWLVQGGESSYVVSQLLGHSSSTMVERVYGRLAPHTMLAAMGKLPG